MVLAGWNDGSTAASRDAYGKTLVELGRQDERIVVLDADLSVSTKTCLFAKEFPKRFFNLGVAEQDLMGVAAGLSVEGKIVFASTFAMFAVARPFDVIRNTIAYPRLNVKIVATHGGITVGEDGSSHQLLEDLAIMRCLPNMTVIVPADALEVPPVIRTIARMSGPFYVRLSRSATPLVYQKEPDFVLGHWPTLKEGTDLAIIACGIMVNASLIAAEKLSEAGVKARVINASTIKPFDEKTLLKAALETKAIVTAEEGTVLGGLGGLIAEFLSEKFPVPIQRVGVKGLFGESGKPEDLLVKYGLTYKEIYEASLKVLSQKSKK